MCYYSSSMSLTDADHTAQSTTRPEIHSLPAAAAVGVQKEISSIVGHSHILQTLIPNYYKFYGIIIYTSPLHLIYTHIAFR